MKLKMAMMVTLCLCFSQMAYAEQVSIGTYIDGYPIPSMNISGYTVNIPL